MAEHPAEIQPARKSIFSTVQWTLLHLYLLGISAVLLGAFWVEFYFDETPCSLCLLQRMAMILAAIGPVWMIAAADGQRQIPLATMSRGFGISILSAVLGMSISLRQMLIHIAPDDPGFGSAVLGYHLYTWAFVVFVVILLVSGTTLIFASQGGRPAGRSRTNWYSRATLTLFGAIILANAIAACIPLRELFTATH
jgi:disulfide bond formation protein DsbB